MEHTLYIPPYAININASQTLSIKALQVNIQNNINIIPASCSVVATEIHKTGNTGSLKLHQFLD